MRKLFLWFYCLPISDAVLLIVLATVVFLFLRERFGNTLYWKAGIPILFVCWIAVMLFGTLGQRTEGENLSEPILIPFYSYYTALNGGSQELYRTNFMNAVLFYPASLLGCELLPERWRKIWKVILVTCVFALLSIGIEYTQYRLAMGLVEADDVMHNTLGALLGALTCGASIKLNQKQ